MAAKDATLYVTTEALSSSSLLTQQMSSVLFGLASHQSRHVFDMSFSSAQTGSTQSGQDYRVTDHSSSFDCITVSFSKCPTTAAQASVLTRSISFNQIQQSALEVASLKVAETPSKLSLITSFCPAISSDYVVLSFLSSSNESLSAVDILPHFLLLNVSHFSRSVSKKFKASSTGLNVASVHASSSFS